MESKKTVCDVCGGDDFYLENGRYFCSDCLTQTQQKEEHVVATQDRPDFEEDHIKERSSKSKTRSKKSHKVTSWEYYNYILLGLTNEMIELGASENLRPTVMYLWMEYLRRLQVISKQAVSVPKLQLLNSSIDAEVVYGKPANAKRKRQKSSVSEVSSLPESDYHARTTVRRRAKKKLREHAALSQETEAESEIETQSFDNDQLATLKSDASVDGASSCKSIFYNRSSSRELVKNSNSRHAREHRRDFDRNLNCHRMTYQTVSKTYQNGPTNLSINKLYIILYLGLLIVNDNRYTLADMFRFIKEGHLSFSNFNSDKFFPENYLGVSKFGRSCRIVEFVNKIFRKRTAKLVNFLNIRRYITPPDLRRLCDRYCKELNLPNEVSSYVKRLISLTDPKMNFTKNSVNFPNYEARVLSLILIVLKLLFGLDGETEFAIAKTAILVNEKVRLEKMFNVVTWLKYLEYRNLVLQEHHYPTITSVEKQCNKTDQFIEFYLNNKDLEESNHKSNAELDNFKHLLEKLRSIQGQGEKERLRINFPVTDTPFYDYTKVLINEGVIEKYEYLTDLLSTEFFTHKVEYALHSDNYADKIKVKSIVNSSFNEAVTYVKLIDVKKKNARYLNQLRKELFVKLDFNYDMTNLLEPVALSASEDENEDEMPLASHQTNLRNTESVTVTDNKSFASGVSVNGAINDDRVSQEVHLHYNAFEHYWIWYRYNCETDEDFKKFFNKFPVSFSLLVSECARICQQTAREFFEEFQLTEIYVLYCSNIRKMKGYNDLLNVMKHRAKSNW